MQYISSLINDLLEKPINLSTASKYTYQIPSRFQTGFRGTREALNENLVETILPFLILDFRWTPMSSRSRWRLASKAGLTRSGR